jgi:biopolymer transport protein ExbB
MYDNSWTLRWAVYFRWVAAMGVGLIAAFCCIMFPAAFGQDRRPAAAVAKVSAPKAEPGKADDAKLDPAEIERRAAAALAESETERKDAKPVQGDQVRETLDIIKDIHWDSVHMWAVYAILAVSLISAAFGLERLFGLRKGKVLPTDLMAGLRALAGRKGEFDLRHAMRLCKQHPSPAAVVIKSMLVKVGRPVGEIEHALSETSDREATRLYANVRWQNLAFNVAPMLGLAGTVHGMIIAFFVTAHMPLGTNKMESLATGIYAALVCTFAGLIVAIPAGIASHFFEGRILAIFNELDDLARTLVPHLERFEGRIRLRGGEKVSEKTAGDKLLGDGGPVDADEDIEPDLSNIDGKGDGKGSRPTISPQK